MSETHRQRDLSDPQERSRIIEDAVRGSRAALGLTLMVALVLGFLGMAAALVLTAKALSNVFTR